MTSRSSRSTFSLVSESVASTTDCWRTCSSWNDARYVYAPMMSTAATTVGKKK